ncbi:LysR family transcriptional regulator [Novispirillum itersonii]|uniref:DNA-binding transcriptional LysR family regulator n=1 Tax=Novispirillum itersonii TaxID=189 RepID=A0A7W9ZGP2_NOVIT|nr:LysR family transcriptional regulator [Novispirillum itersonii]MBB6210282.1 DNA-binding transcriptional LysR family regulator [Novispirillum itersonii]
MTEKPVDLDLVRAFLAVAARGSFRQAAEQLNRTQAAVSQQVQRLEEALGVALAERTTRRVSLTVAGERFRPFAEQLLALEAQARRAVRQAPAPARRVRIGAPDEVAGALLLPGLPALSRQRPDLRVQVVSGPTGLLRQGLGTTLEMVVGLQVGPGGDGRLVTETPLRWVGTLPQGLPHDPPPCAPLPLVLPLALFPDGCVMRRQMLAALDRAGVAWRIVLEADGVAAVEAAVASGLAVTALPACCISRPLPPADGLPPLPPVQIRLWSADGLDPALTMALLEHLTGA